MGQYTLVKKESLEAVANAIRQKGGTADELIFPDGFVAAILALNTSPATPTSETLGLWLHYGYQFSASVNDYIAVGANSGHTNDDAVWAFTPTIDATAATFRFTWDNYCGGSSNNGWASAMEYAFAITTDSSRGMIAQNAATKSVVTLSGSSGEAVVEFTGLSLIKGTTYYIRANFNGTTTSTLKAFAKDGNTVYLTT